MAKCLLKGSNLKINIVINEYVTLTSSIIDQILELCVFTMWTILVYMDHCISDVDISVKLL